MDKVRFGIIGVGNMGSSHAKNLLAGKVENATLAAICDLDTTKMSKITSLEGGEKVKTFVDYKEMLASRLIDAVIVAVPHYFHPPITIEALTAGLHVVCEKPAGVYTKQVKEMIAVAEKSDKLFTMMFNQRTNCVYRKMREIIAEGKIGEIKRVNWLITNWYRSQSYYDSGAWRATWKGEGGGVLFNQCPHQLDLLSWVLGMMPEKLHSFCHFGKWHDIEVEDDVSVYMEFPNGATGVFVTSTGDTPGTNRFEVLGNNGKIVCDGNSLTLTMLEVGEREFNASCKSDDGKPIVHAEPKHFNVPVETDGKNPQHVGILSNFANAILGIEPLFVDGREGLNGVELMDAMLLSTWLGKDISLPIDDEEYLTELKKRIASGRELREGTAVVLDTAGTYGTK